MLPLATRMHWKGEHVIMTHHDADAAFVCPSQCWSGSLRSDAGQALVPPVSLLLQRLPGDMSASCLGPPGADAMLQWGTPAAYTHPACRPWSAAGLSLATLCS